MDYQQQHRTSNLDRLQIFPLFIVCKCWSIFVNHLDKNEIDYFNQI